MEREELSMNKKRCLFSKLEKTEYVYNTDGVDVFRIYSNFNKLQPHIVNSTVRKGETLAWCIWTNCLSRK